MAIFHSHTAKIWIKWLLAFYFCFSRCRHHGNHQEAERRGKKRENHWSINNQMCLLNFCEHLNASLKVAHVLFTNPLQPFQMFTRNKLQFLPLYPRQSTIETIHIATFHGKCAQRQLGRRNRDTTQERNCYGPEENPTLSAVCVCVDAPAFCVDRSAKMETCNES